MRRMTTKKPVRKRIDPVEAIRIEVIPSGAGARGWVHTHGMEKFGLPELEIRGAWPVFLTGEAVKILNRVADYMLNSSGKKIRKGETVALDRYTVVRFMSLEPIVGEEGHYQVARWTLVDVMDESERRFLNAAAFRTVWNSSRGRRTMRA